MYFDKKLLLLLLLIPCISLLVLYSAGYSPDTNIQLASWLPLVIKSQAFFKQLINFLIGWLVLFSAYFVGIKFFYKASLPVFLLSIILLIIVLLIGSKSHGSVRWVPIGPIRFQPSEFAKVAVILVFAWYLTKFPASFRGYNLKSLFFPGILLLLITIPVLLQPDLGTTLSIGIIACSMVLFAGVNRKILTYVAILFICSLPFAWQFVLKPYQKQRIETLFNPESDPYGHGYHVIQSKIAVGSGGIYGKGFLQGTQTQLEFLPEHTTDFIFSVLAEEWGFLGTSFILLLYFLLVRHLFWLALNAVTPFQRYLCFGFAIMLFSHVFVNIGMVLGILPVVGLPLPLFSYGGSMMIVTMLLAGISLRVSSERQRL